MADFQIDDNGVSSDYYAWKLALGAKADGSEVYYAWVEGHPVFSTPGRVRFRKGTNHGTTLGSITNIGSHFTPGGIQMATNNGGDNIYLGFHDRVATSTYELYLNKSTNGGTSWDTDSTLISIEQGTVIFPRTAFSLNNSGHLYLHYLSNTDVLKFVASYNGGTIWTPPRTISSKAKSPVLAKDNGSNAYLVWVKQVSESQADIMFSRTASSGRRWLPEQVLFSYNSFGIQLRCDITADNYGNVYIFYSLSDPALAGKSPLYMIKSSDYGATWGNPVEVVATGDSVGLIRSIAISNTSSSDSEILVTWGAGFSQEVRTRKSTDSGSTWGIVKVVATDIDFYQEPLLMRNSSKTVLTWENFSGSTKLLQYQVSSNDGTSWAENYLTLSEDGEGSITTNGDSLLTSDNYLIAGWTDYGNGGNALKPRLFGNSDAL